jgi:two-component system, LytTR family, sensor kinase
MQIRRYSGKEPIIFAWVMAPYTIVMNALVFGACIFSSLKVFAESFIISAVYFAFIYAVFGTVALMIRKRFPQDGDLFRRIALMLPIFYLMNILTVQCLYILYESINWSPCKPLRSMEWWTVGFGCLASTMLTFINEAAAGWDKWKTSVTETGRLQSAYQKSRLLSLKRQINPHFLFNCFNTLSSLISEDGDEAEQFLDEMTKVYRYLLKGDEDPLVSLDEELKFIDAYLYLNITRFGSALDVAINVEESSRRRMIAPLSLQIILENIIYRNAFSKANPVHIHIYTNTHNALVIHNTLQPKNSSDAINYEEALDDLVNKYKLLSQKEVEIYETATQRDILIPLIEKEEVLA